MKYANWALTGWRRLETDMPSAIEAWWSTATFGWRWYAAGLTLIALGLILAWIPFIGPQNLLAAGATCLAVGYISEAAALLLKMASSIVGKLIGALAGTMVAALAMALSSTTINMATGLNPDFFPYARAFLAPLTGGYILVLALFATFVVTITVGALVVSLRLLLILREDLSTRASNGVCRELGRQLLRLVAAVCMISVATDVWNSTQREYSRALESVASSFIYYFEMYPKDSCVGSTTDRAKRINETELVVGQRINGNLSFVIKSCHSFDGPT